MTKQDNKSKLRLEIKQMYIKEKGEYLSDFECDQAADNLSKFVRLLIDIDIKAKKEKIKDGEVKCKTCKVKITTFEDFCNISTDPMCPKCYADYLENHPK